MNGIEAARINQALVEASNLASFLALQTDMVEELRLQTPAKKASRIKKLQELTAKAEKATREAEALLKGNAA